MRAGAAISLHPIPATAVGEVVGEILESVGPDADLLVVFVSTAHAGALEDIVPALQSLLHPKAMIGCLAEGVVGCEQEVTGVPAISLLALSGVPASVVHLEMFDDALLARFDQMASPGCNVVLLADPRTFSPEPLFNRFDEHGPLTISGGYAAPGPTLSAGSLIIDGQIIKTGAVALFLNVETNALVAHGAKPVGVPLAVTGADGKTILQLAGASALQRLTDMLQADFSEEDLVRAGAGLMIGRVVDDKQEKFGVGDFVVRPLLDTDPITGGITLSDDIAVGTVVQFQVPDEGVAALSLTTALAGRSARAALMFTSMVRVIDLFETSSYDALAVSDILDNPPLAGMVTNGEFGPVAGVSVVNGLTASLTLIGDRTG